MGLSLKGRRGAATLAAVAVGVVGAGAAIGVAATSGGGGDREQAFADALSERVGAEVTPEDLQAARESVAKERLDEAVAEGRITQEQADEMLQRLREMPERREQAHAAKEATQAPIAAALGMSADELHEARHDGKTLLEIAKDKGVSRDKLEAAVTKGIQAGAKAAGRDAPTGDDLTELVDRIVESEHPGPGGPRGGRGGPGGPGLFGGPLGP